MQGESTGNKKTTLFEVLLEEKILRILSKNKELYQTQLNKYLEQQYYIQPSRNSLKKVLEKLVKEGKITRTKEKKKNLYSIKKKELKTYNLFFSESAEDSNYLKPNRIQFLNDFLRRRENRIIFDKFNESQKNHFIHLLNDALINENTTLEVEIKFNYLLKTYYYIEVEGSVEKYFNYFKDLIEILKRDKQNNLRQFIKFLNQLEESVSIFFIDRISKLKKSKKDRLYDYENKIPIFRNSNIISSIKDLILYKIDFLNIHFSMEETLFPLYFIDLIYESSHEIIFTLMNKKISGSHNFIERLIENDAIYSFFVLIGYLFIIALLERSNSERASEASLSKNNVLPFLNNKRGFRVLFKFFFQAELQEKKESNKNKEVPSYFNEYFFLITLSLRQFIEISDEEDKRKMMNLIEEELNNLLNPEEQAREKDKERNPLNRLRNLYSMKRPFGVLDNIIKDLYLMYLYFLFKKQLKQEAKERNFDRAINYFEEIFDVFKHKEKFPSYKPGNEGSILYHMMENISKLFEWFLQEIFINNKKWKRGSQKYTEILKSYFSFLKSCDEALIRKDKNEWASIFLNRLFRYFVRENFTIDEKNEEFRLLSEYAQKGDYMMMYYYTIQLFKEKKYEHIKGEFKKWLKNSKDLSTFIVYFTGIENRITTYLLLKESNEGKKKDNDKKSNSKDSWWSNITSEELWDIIKTYEAIFNEFITSTNKTSGSFLSEHYLKWTIHLYTVLLYQTEKIEATFIMALMGLFNEINNKCYSLDDLILRYTPSMRKIKIIERGSLIERGNINIKYPSTEFSSFLFIILYLIKEKELRKPLSPEKIETELSNLNKFMKFLEKVFLGNNGRVKKESTIKLEKLEKILRLYTDRRKELIEILNNLQEIIYVLYEVMNDETDKILSFEDLYLFLKEKREKISSITKEKLKKSFDGLKASFQGDRSILLKSTMGWLLSLAALIIGEEEEKDTINILTRLLDEFNYFIPAHLLKYQIIKTQLIESRISLDPNVLEKIFSDITSSLIKNIYHQFPYKNIQSLLKTNHFYQFPWFYEEILKILDEITSLEGVGTHHTHQMQVNRDYLSKIKINDLLMILHYYHHYIKTDERSFLKKASIKKIFEQNPIYSSYYEMYESYKKQHDIPSVLEYFKKNNFGYDYEKKRYNPPVFQTKGLGYTLSIPYWDRVI